MSKVLYVFAVIGVILAVLCLVAAFAQMNDPNEDEQENERIAET